MPSHHILRQPLLIVSITLSGCGGDGSAAPSTQKGLTGAPKVAAAAGVAVALTASANCPRDSAGYPDGCDAANPASVLQIPNFFSGYAAQSGQTYATRPAWSVAGVDYPVGYYTPQAQLRDPTIPSNLPRSCRFDSASDTVNCQGTGPLALSGLDFSLHNGVRLHIYSSYSGTITLSNNYFRNGSASDTTTFLVRIDDAPAKLVDTNNVYDGNAQNFPQYLSYLLADLRTGNYATTHQYNAFLNMPQKGVSIPASSASLFHYNYCGDIEVRQYAHGQCIIFGGATATSPSHADQYNTYFESASPPDGHQDTGGITSMQYISSGLSGTQFMNVLVTNNSIVTNLRGGAGGALTVSSNVELAYSTYAQINFRENFIDSTGSYYAFAVLSGATCQSLPFFSGNINLITGADITGWSANGGNGC